MFSSKDLVQFVFADDKDRYYCDNLLSFNLNQFLWYQLHLAGYSKVYFLRCREKQPELWTYALPSASDYSSKQTAWDAFLGKSPNAVLAAWMQKRMREETAFVCPLEDFCQCFGEQSWKEHLASLARDRQRKGTLVLVCSLFAERSLDVLLNHPIFETLRERTLLSLRNAQECDFFASLRSRKGDGCAFLHLWTQERAYALLLHAALCRSGCSSTPEELERMSAVLCRCIRDPVERHRSGLPFPAPEQCSWSRVYHLLEDDGFWNALETYSQQQGLPQAQGERAPALVRRSPDGFAGRCMQLTLRHFPNAPSEQESAEGILREIQSMLGRPRNRMENPEIRKAVSQFILKAELAADQEDAGTCTRALYAARFCVQSLSTAPGSEEEAGIFQVIEQLQQYVQLSSDYYTRTRDLKLYRQQVGDHSAPMVLKALQQLSDQVRAAEELLKRREDTVYASIVQLSVAATSQSITACAQSLSDDLSALLPQMSHQEEPEEEEFVIRDSDYNYIPPSYQKG